MYDYAGQIFCEMLGQTCYKEFYEKAEIEEVVGTPSSFSKRMNLQWNSPPNMYGSNQLSKFYLEPLRLSFSSDTTSSKPRKSILLMFRTKPLVPRQSFQPRNGTNLCKSTLIQLLDPGTQQLVPAVYILPIQHTSIQNAQASTGGKWSLPYTK
jgi:hypothetical protein